jgi:CheY-like chemotaxis protein
VTKSTRILVVDDDPENLSGMCELLAFWGYEAEGVADGKAALEAAGRRCPDVAVMDLGLPDGDALHVIEELKALAVFVIAFSGWDKAEPGALAAGADAFVLKPNLDALEELLRNIPLRAVDVPAKQKRSKGG